VEQECYPNFHISNTSFITLGYAADEYLPKELWHAPCYIQPGRLARDNVSFWNHGLLLLHLFFCFYISQRNCVSSSLIFFDQIRWWISTDWQRWQGKHLCAGEDRPSRSLRLFMKETMQIFIYFSDKECIDTPRRCCLHCFTYPGAQMIVYGSVQINDSITHYFLFEEDKQHSFLRPQMHFPLGIFICSCAVSCNYVTKKVQLHRESANLREQRTAVEFWNTSLFKYLPKLKTVSTTCLSLFFVCFGEMLQVQKYNMIYIRNLFS
jgi:hypothetical protein